MIFLKKTLLVLLTLLLFISGCGQKEAKQKYELTPEGIISPKVAEEIIKDTSDTVLLALKNKDAKTLSEYTHPIKGVRFTPYTYVSLENDIIFHEENMLNFFIDQNTYVWGAYDGSGFDISLTPSEYFEKFIYSKDFISPDKVGYNEVLTQSNALENQFSVYELPIVVEYCHNGTAENASLDWVSLRLVFEEYENKWYLTGIIHCQWTI